MCGKAALPDVEGAPAMSRTGGFVIYLTLGRCTLNVQLLVFYVFTGRFTRRLTGGGGVAGQVLRRGRSRRADRAEDGQADRG